MNLWAGIECTVNRIGDDYFDQIKQSGHDCRPEDIELLHGLGIRTLRYPFLWEKIAPNCPHQFDWTWADERLDLMRTLEINPIAGLLHHGSGPVYSSLIDPEFPEQFARYAAAFAQRYPWISDYTPINEPLTTARFSGLYGHWYPHARDEHSFLTMLIHQCKGIQLAMQEIRKVNPAARLIQTEDMGKYWHTHGLESCADFLNTRRWLSLDLLCGRVNPEHPLWYYLLDNGIAVAQLEYFLEFPCPPDVVGINYYVVSERLIDAVYTEYPPNLRNDYETHGYVDIESVRTEIPINLASILRETWERYQLPIAITEAHLNCTREEQLRWLLEIWQIAQHSKQQGIELLAVTVWSVFGAFNWDKLLTCQNGCYESGAFDVRGPGPRPTALAEMIKCLAQGTNFQHPVLSSPGWWRREERIFYNRPSLHEMPLISTESFEYAHASEPHLDQRPLLITGASGTLGQAFARICTERAINYRLLSRQELDITDDATIRKVLAEINPWAVINTAGFVRVDDAENEPDICFRENTLGPALLAAACQEFGCQLMTFSSDLVFGEPSIQPITERSAVMPLNVYGWSKAKAEAKVLKAMPDAFIVRTSAFFGPWDEHNFVWSVMQHLQQGKVFYAPNDTVISPTYVPDLVNVSLDLLIDRTRGIWHLSNRGALSWVDFGKQIARSAGLDPGLVLGCSSNQLGLRAKRPAYSVLGSERGQLLPDLDRAIERFMEMREAVLHL